MLWRIRAARLNMQITKCFIGNGLELRVPTPIWALCLMLFYTTTSEATKGSGWISKHMVGNPPTWVGFQTTG